MSSVLERAKALLNAHQVHAVAPKNPSNHSMEWVKRASR